MIGKTHGTIGMTGIVSSLEWMQFKLCVIIKVSKDLRLIDGTINIIARLQLMCIDSCTFPTKGCIGQWFDATTDTIWAWLHIKSIAWLASRCISESRDNRLGCIHWYCCIRRTIVDLPIRTANSNQVRDRV